MSRSSLRYCTTVIAEPVSGIATDHNDCDRSQWSSRWATGLHRGRFRASGVLSDTTINFYLYYYTNTSTSNMYTHLHSSLFYCSFIVVWFVLYNVSIRSLCVEASRSDRFVDSGASWPVCSFRFGAQNTSYLFKTFHLKFPPYFFSNRIVNYRMFYTILRLLNYNRSLVVLLYSL